MASPSVYAKGELVSRIRWLISVVLPGLCHDSVLIESFEQQESQEEAAFQQLKQLLEAPVLVHLDPSKQYILDTDASNEYAHTVLSQMVDG